MLLRRVEWVIGYFDYRPIIFIFVSRWTNPFSPSTTKTIPSNPAKISIRCDRTPPSAPHTYRRVALPILNFITLAKIKYNLPNPSSPNYLNPPRKKQLLCKNLVNQVSLLLLKKLKNHNKRENNWAFWIGKWLAIFVGCPRKSSRLLAASAAALATTKPNGWSKSESKIKWCLKDCSKSKLRLKTRRKSTKTSIEHTPTIQLSAKTQNSYKCSKKYSWPIVCMIQS